MVMGRSYKWRWHRKVVKGDKEALNGNKEMFWQWKVFKCQWRGAQGRHKGVKEQNKK